MFKIHACGYQMISSHQNNPGSYLTIARLLSHPETILEASDNEELQHILNLARESENQQHSEINTYSGSGSGS